MFLNGNDSSAQILEIVQIAIENIEKYGSIFKVWMGPKLTMTIGVVEDVEIILNSPDCLEKAFFYKFFDCNKGLISAPGKNDNVQLCFPFVSEFI